MSDTTDTVIMRDYFQQVVELHMSYAKCKECEFFNNDNCTQYVPDKNTCLVLKEHT